MRPNKKPSNKNGNYYIYGRHAALAALKNPNRTILDVSCTEEFFSEHRVMLSKHKYKMLDNREISHLLPPGALHQGISLYTKPIALNHIEDVDLSSENAKVAILDQITDEHNVGAILRSAAAFGIKAIICTQDNSATESGVMAKIASGALEIVPLVKVVNMRSAIEDLMSKGFWVAGLDGSGNDVLSSDKLKGKIAIVLGAEGSGMRRLTKESCDFIARIPMEENSESINVSNAAAIAFYTIYRN